MDKIDANKPLPNIRHELFCQHRGSGTQQTEAYIKAGYKDGKSVVKAACNLASKVYIRLRVLAISGEIADKLHEKAISVTRDTQSTKLQETIEACDRDDNVRVNAIREQNKLFGLSIDKTVNEDEHETLTEAEQQAAKEWVAFSASPEYPDLAAYAARQARDKVRATHISAWGDTTAPAASEAILHTREESKTA